ncbi:MAG: zinc-binding alcohol dehydrogenase [Anaeromyxobacter sp.]
MIAIGRNLCASIPANVTFEQAAFTSVATIGMEGVRLARVTLGERVLVIGLGLIGQICVALLKANGCRVFGIDVDPAKLELARAFGADEVAIGSPADAIKRFGGGVGVDAVVITAATASNGPVELAAEVCRPRGRIVLVGVVGLNLPRPPFFQKELEFTVSGSLGPGRWDATYEEKGIDYPLGQVRWTAQRNMQAVLDLISSGKLPVEKLVSHRFPIERAAEAYESHHGRSDPVPGGGARLRRAGADPFAARGPRAEGAGDRRGRRELHRRRELRAPHPPPGAGAAGRLRPARALHGQGPLRRALRARQGVRLRDHRRPGESGRMPGRRPCSSPRGTTSTPTWSSRPCGPASRSSSRSRSASGRRSWPRSAGP